MIPFSLGERSVSDSPEIGDCHSFTGLFGTPVDPTMLTVTFGYSTSDEDSFLLERRLLVTLVVEVSCKRVNTDGLAV